MNQNDKNGKRHGFWIFFRSQQIREVWKCNFKHGYLIGYEEDSYLKKHMEKTFYLKDKV